MKLFIEYIVQELKIEFVKRMVQLLLGDLTQRDIQMMILGMITAILVVQLVYG